MVRFDADAYQKMALETQIYSEAARQFIDEPATQQLACLEMMYCVGKLNGEAGEAAEIVFKNFRGAGGYLSGDEKVKLQKELGDVLWYVANIAHLIGMPLSVIMEQNLEKLQDRKDRGVVHGYGDDR